MELHDVDEEYRDMYKKHWKTVSSQKIGMIKDIIHFPIYRMDDNEIIKVLNNVREKYARIKVNMSLGYILRNREDNALKFFHPSNNNMLFKVPLKVDTDYKNLKDELLNTDWYEFVRQQRPSTKWLVEKIICIRFDIYKL